MKSTDPLEEPYVRELHHRMFDSVWKWAGSHRKTELNIGCDPKEIVQRIPQLLANTRYWLENKTFSAHLHRMTPFAEGCAPCVHLTAFRKRALTCPDCFRVSP